MRKKDKSRNQSAYLVISDSSQNSRKQQTQVNSISEKIHPSLKSQTRHIVSSSNEKSISQNKQFSFKGRLTKFEVDGIPKKKVKPNENTLSSTELIRFDQKAESFQNEPMTERQIEVSDKRKLKRATPWLSSKTKQIEDSCLKFHNQIVEFYDYIKPSKKEHENRCKIIRLVQGMIVQKYPTCKIVSFGSFATKLYLPDGDIDLTVVIDVSDEYEEKKIYDNIHKIIKRQEDIIFTQIQYIRKSKVPLIKFIHTETQLQFDVSVNKTDGIGQIEHVDRMRKMYPQFQPLVFVFKCALKIREMNETYTGGIGSFLLFCMILHFIRSNHKKGCYYSMGELVLKFMEFYSITGDWDRKSIYVSDGEQVSRPRQPGTLSFFSPQDDEHDIGRSAYKIRDPFNMMKNRFRVILGKNFGKDQSILKQLINPSMEDFRYYKYEKKQKESKI